MITDTRGERVLVVIGRVIKFRATGVGVEELRKLQVVQLAIELWQGPPHHVKTHALRLLQACCCSLSSDDDQAAGDMRKLRDGIQPNQLLQQSGLSTDATKKVLADLSHSGLLLRRQHSRKPRWFVNISIKGFGPAGERYKAADLVDGWALPADVFEEPPASDQGDAVHSTRGFREDRHEILTKVYGATLKYVLESPEIDKDGYALFTTPGPLTELVAAELGITKSQAGYALQNLTKLEIYKPLFIGQGHWCRYIKLGAGPFTEAQVEQVRSANRQKVAVRRNRSKGEGRLAMLPEAFQALVRAVPEGLTPGKDGFVEFETDYPLKKYLSDEIRELSPAQAERLLEDFRFLGILINKNHGNKTVRRLKVRHRFTDEDYVRIRGARRSTIRSGAGTATPPATPPSKGAGMGSGQLAELLKRMDGENEDLKAKLAAEEQAHAATRAELEIAKAAATQVEIPDELLTKYHLT